MWRAALPILRKLELFERGTVAVIARRESVAADPISGGQSKSLTCTGAKSRLLLNVSC